MTEKERDRIREAVKSEFVSFLEWDDDSQRIFREFCEWLVGCGFETESLNEHNLCVLLEIEFG